MMKMGRAMLRAFEVYTYERHLDRLFSLSYSRMAAGGKFVVLAGDMNIDVARAECGR